MSQNVKRNWQIQAAFLLLFFSFVVIVLYINARFAVMPYLGFTYDGPAGSIVQVDVDSGLLQPEDVIEKVNGVPWAVYAADRTQASFTEYRPGDTIPLLIRRDGQLIEVGWPVTGPIARVVLDRFFNSWLVSPVFWFFGLLAVWLIRPRDTRWFLLILFYGLTALWIMAGANSSTKVWYSSIVVRALTWPLVLVLLHYHWIFPRTLGVLSRTAAAAAYALAGGMMVAELAQLPPRAAYGLAALAGVVGSAILLVIHAVRQPDSRRDLQVLTAMFILIVLAIFGLNWLGSMTHRPNMIWISIIFLALIPFTYFYLAYRRQAGGMQVRANRWVSFLFYTQGMIVLAALGLGLALWMDWEPVTELLTATGIILSLGIAGTALYPRFQRWFERRVLGISLPPEEVVDALTRQIAASPDRESLQEVLVRDIFPSLLIRQAAVLQFLETDEQGIPRRVEPVIHLNVTREQLPPLQDLPRLLQAGPLDQPAAGWVRLALPLEYRGHPIGAALFGRRDPDDEYSPAELPILRTLLSQTALALVNTDQAALLHALQRHEIERREEERRRLARDLHDDVLGQLALVAHSVDDSNLNFRDAYQGAVTRAREIIGGLRPATLEQFGLYSALEELLDELDRRIGLNFGAGPLVSLDLDACTERYPAEAELAVYRIIQQACLNALDHAQAAHLTIRGRLEPGRIDLTVEDDGVGFEAQPGELIPMLVHGHYGMLNMYERANLAGAHLAVTSAPSQGVQVRVTWNSLPPEQ